MANFGKKYSTFKGLLKRIDSAMSGKNLCHLIKSCEPYLHFKKSIKSIIVLSNHYLFNYLTLKKISKFRQSKEKGCVRNVIHTQILGRIRIRKKQNREQCWIAPRARKISLDLQVSDKTRSLASQAGMPEPPIFEIFGSGSSSRQIQAPAPTPTPSHSQSHT